MLQPRDSTRHSQGAEGTLEPSAGLVRLGTQAELLAGEAWEVRQATGLMVLVVLL